MKKTFLFLFVLITLGAMAQTKPVSKPVALPQKFYQNLKDSCTQMDIVFYSGAGGSMSLDGKNVKMFTNFVAPSPAVKQETAKQDGHIMWQINGREYLTGKLFLTADSMGYLVFDKDAKEYVNALIPQGASFLNTHGKKKK